MRQPGGAPECRNLFSILYPSGLPSSTSCPPDPAELDRDPLNAHIKLRPASLPSILGGQDLMSGLPGRLLG